MTYPLAEIIHNFHSIYNIDPDAGRYCFVRRQPELECCFHIKDISGYHVPYCQDILQGITRTGQVSKKLPRNSQTLDINEDMQKLKLELHYLGWNISLVTLQYRY